MLRTTRKNKDQRCVARNLEGTSLLFESKDVLITSVKEMRFLTSKRQRSGTTEDQDKGAVILFKGV